MNVNPTSYLDACSEIADWIANRTAAYVCAATVHMVMEGYDDPDYRRAVNEADLVTPDGMPLVWCLRKLGYRDQQRVYGPDLMLALLERAVVEGWTIGLYGGEAETLARLEAILPERYPGIRLAYVHSPPFRPLTEDESRSVSKKIRDSGVQLLFVGLGCPKQERFMARMKTELPCVMVGVGAAFLFHAGTVRQAPACLQRAGLEWLFRLLMEPRRLWRRYAKHNPRFLLMALMPTFLRLGAARE